MSTATVVPGVRKRTFNGPPRRIGRVKEEECVYPLDHEIREKWCAALRSERYKAGSLTGRDFHDRAGERWSPLGVLRSALRLPWGEVWEVGPLAYVPEPRAVLRYCPPKRPEWTGWDPIDRAERDRFGLDVQLLAMVDACLYIAWEWTFAEIADWIDLNTYSPD